MKELELYQRGLDKKLGGGFPDLLVVAIDGNCASFSEARKAVANALRSPLSSCAVQATPDPHVERWFLADLEAFHRVVGVTPELETRKCERDYYKRFLAGAIAEAGHPATFGGIELRGNSWRRLDYYRAGKADQSLKHFLEELKIRDCDEIP